MPASGSRDDLFLTSNPETTISSLTAFTADLSTLWMTKPLCRPTMTALRKYGAEQRGEVYWGDTDEMTKLSFDHRTLQSSGSFGHICQRSER